MEQSLITGKAPEESKMFHSKSLDGYLLSAENYQSDDRENKIKQCLTKISSKKNNSLVGFYFILLFFSLFAAFLNQTNKEPLTQVLIPIVTALFAIIFYTHDRYQSRTSPLQYRKELFNLLSEAPYEVRLSWTSWQQKSIKFLIEENLVKPGGVIKEKSRHLTAYLDYTANPVDQIRFITELVKKAEDSFSKK